MLTGVPYNVNVPEFQPERSAPVFPVVTRKYPCIEDVVTQDYARFDTLTWKIQQPDQSMVWQSVKLVLPLEMKAYRAAAVTLANMPDAAAELDMRVASKRPACNIAVAESPMGAFRQSSLTINGRIFSEVNDYRRVLDACYRGTGPSSYGDNHSLKPIVCRDIHAPVSDQYTVVTSDGADPPRYTDVLTGGRANIVRIEDHNARTIDSAFSLLEHNGPFIERARKFQDELSYDGKTWKGLITNYLELGPFQARARVSNTAVPYVRDLHLRLNFDTNPSRFDARMGTEMTGLPLSSCRTIPCKLFEFGTVPNILHLGESIRRTADFICGMQLKYTEKPYLEVQYVRYIEPMKSFYNLRCFEHQYEQSNPFQLIAPQASLVSPTSLQRVTSRLLSYPTKIYLYASLSDTEQNPYIMGNVRRSCLLENIHCRINQRADIIFNPSQEECYQMFRRHTNSSLEYGAWLKSPIYCFDPVDLGQPDFLANDARLSLMEWDTSVSLTALQIQEQDEALKMNSIESMGYKSDFTSSTWLGVNSAQGNLVAASWNNNSPAALANAAHIYNICMDFFMLPADTTTGITLVGDAQLMVGRTFQFSNVKYLGVHYPPTTSEMIKITTAGSRGTRFKGMIWAQVQTAVGQGQNQWSVVGNRLYWVPETYLLDMLPANADVINQYSELTTTVVPVQNQDNTFTYVVTPGCKFLAGARIRFAGNVLDRREINPAAQFNARGAQITPGPFAYVTDQYGIRNQNALGNAVYATPGLNPPGGAFTRADQRANVNVKWACFRPTQAMWNGGADPDQMVIRWRGTNAPEHQQAGTTTPLLNGHCGLYIRGNMERDQGVPNKAINNAIMNWDPQTGVTWPLNDITFKDYADPEFDYTLKALYEYGNCQYQFTADGAPTKVLPNLVPTRDSNAIPIV